MPLVHRILALPTYPGGYSRETIGQTIREPVRIIAPKRRSAMTVSVDMGSAPAGKPALVDLEELLATRLLVQGNSGSGKSHLLRRLLEEQRASGCSRS